MSFDADSKVRHTDLPCVILLEVALWTFLDALAVFFSMDVCWHFSSVSAISLSGSSFFLAPVPKPALHWCIFRISVVFRLIQLFRLPIRGQSLGMVSLILE